MAVPEDKVEEVELTSLQKLALEQRDKHVEQFMKVNGQATFAVLSASFVVLFGAKDLMGLLSDKPAASCKLTLLLVLGAVLLGIGALFLSYFHTTRIRKLQKFCEKNIRGLPKGSFQLIPQQSFTFMPIFAGLVLLVAFAFSVLNISLQAPKILPCKEEAAARVSVTCPPTAAVTPPANKGQAN